MHCQYCQDSAKHNAFTMGCSKFIKRRTKTHAATNDHHAAVEAKSLPIASKRVCNLSLCICVTVGFFMHLKNLLFITYYTVQYSTDMYSTYMINKIRLLPNTFGY